MAALVAGCTGDRPGGVLFIGIDTLRADRLGCYGYPRPTSPRIDALAREAVVFEQAISQSSWTLPAFASMMTGVLPARHGAGEGKSCLVAACPALGPELPTLAELFAQAGYRTASFVSNGFVGTRVGLGRGFERVDELGVGASAVRATAAWLDEHRRDPFFAFVHVVDPHAPYAPPAEERALFVDTAYAGPVVPERSGWLRGDWDDADRRYISDLYDGEVRWTDRLVGELLDALSRLGLDDRTLVVLVSDHGEELFDHMGLGHGHSMYDEVLHVPLIVRFPGGAPRGRVGRQVRAMDTFPTVLAAMGRPVPAGIDAMSLMDLAQGETGASAFDVAVAEFTYRSPELRAVRRPHEKLILDVLRNRPRLFDLDADPEERTDLAQGNPDRVAGLRRLLPRPMIHAAAGFYLLVRGGKRVQRVQIRATAPGTRFAEAAVQGGEPDDAVTLAPDGIGATVDVSVGPTDAEVVWFGMSPMVATLRLESVAVDGQPLDPTKLVLGRTPARSYAQLPMNIGAPSVVVQSIEMPGAGPDGTLRLAVQSVIVGKRPAMQLDPVTRSRLQALGYGD